MFINEINKKLDINSVKINFTLTMIGNNKLVVSGVKKVLFASKECVKLQIKSDTLEINGDMLYLKEIGGGDVYIKGEIVSVAFEK